MNDAALSHAGTDRAGGHLDQIAQLICRVERHLSGDTVRAVVARVVRGPVVRQRAARELQTNPGVLLTGRSPSVWSVGLLLAALKKAGAVEVSAPRCCGCDKELRTLFSRRGGYWGCNPCLHPPQDCVSCGRRRMVSTRDSRGRPLCQKCSTGDDAEDALVDLVTRLEPTLPANVVREAFQGLATRAVVRRRAARAVLEAPDLLTGRGAEAPEPVILHFVDHLVAVGASTVIKPPCPQCGDFRPLTQRIADRRVCNRCYQATRIRVCSRCRKERPVAWRDGNGLLVCHGCRHRDPAIHERCSRCGQQRPVARRDEDNQPMCGSCRPHQEGTCSICGRRAMVEISRATGRPRCGACGVRWLRCSQCATMAPVMAGTTQAPVCARCLNPDPAFWKLCACCGRGWQLTASPCQWCQLDDGLNALLADEDGMIRPDMQPFQATLRTVERPDTALIWLRKPRVRAILTGLRDDPRPVDHPLLDELPQDPSVAHLRSVLVASGVLVRRDERLVLLERMADDAVAGRADLLQRRAVHGYTHWRLLRRLRQRLGEDGTTTHQQFVNVREHIRAAIAFLNWLRDRNQTLATCAQADVDAYALQPEIRSKETAAFIRWARTHRHARDLTLQPILYAATAGPFAEDERWEAARRLLHDDGLRAADRVAGLLIVLYAQQLATISRLTTSHVTLEKDRVLIALGPSPILLAPPVDQIMRELITSRRGRSMVGVVGESPWLFPGGRASHHIGESGLRKRMRKVGIRPRAGRNAALFALAAEVPAAILSRKLGLSIDVAAHWQNLSAGDWTAYASDLANR